jgi:hypothetical protein
MAKGFSDPVWLFASGTIEFYGIFDDSFHSKRARQHS